MHRHFPASLRRRLRFPPSCTHPVVLARVAFLVPAALLASICLPASAQTIPSASPFVLNPLRISESASSADVLFVLNEPAPSDITLNLSFFPGPNLPPSAYIISEPHEQLTVPAGELRPEEPVTITSVDNAIFTGPRTLTILAIATVDSISTLASLGLPFLYQKTLVINDDERPPDIEDPLTLRPAVLAEAGATAELSMEIPFRALSTLHFDVSVASGSKVPSSLVTFPGSTRLSIGQGERRTTQSVSVRVGDDFDVTGPRILTLVAVADEDSAESLRDLGQPSRYEIDIEVSDNDRVNPSVTPLRLAPASISEAGGMATVTMVLPFPAPGDFDVEISVKSGDGASPDDVTLSSPPTLSFSAGSTRSSGRVTITAVDNVPDTPDRTVTVVAAPDVLVRPVFTSHGYDETFVAELTLTDDDQSFADDSPLLVAPAAVAEGGEAHVTAILPFASLTAMTVEITVEDARGRAAEGVTVSAPGVLSFSEGAIEPDQRLTIALSDDDRVSGPRDLTVVATVDPIAAALLAEVGQPGSFTAPLTVVDDDRPEFVVSPARVNVTEGNSASVTVRLSTRIDVPLVLRAVPAPGGALTVSPERIEFAPGDWSRPRTLRLSAPADDDAAGAVHRVAFVLEGPPLAGLRVADIHAELVDPDIHALSVSPGEVALTEGGPAVTVAVSLAARPEADVSLRYALSAVRGASSLEVATPQGLVIKPDTWDQPLEFVLSAPEDPDATGFHLGALVIAPEGGGDARLAPVTVLVSILDNDLPALMVSPERLALDEGGAPTTVSVSFGARPPSAVTVSAEVPADAPVSVSPASVHIEPADWDRPVAFSVSAPDDADADPYAGAITLVPSGPGAGAIAPVDVSIEVVDSDPGLDVVPGGPVALLPGESATFTVAVPGGAGPVGTTVSVDAPLLLQSPAEFDLVGPGAKVDVTIAAPAETASVLPRVAKVRFVSSEPARAASVTRKVRLSAPSVSPDARPLAEVFPGLLPAVEVSPVQLALGAGAGSAPVLVRLSSAPSAPVEVTVRVDGAAASDVRLAGPDGAEVASLRLDFVPGSNRWRTGVPVSVLARRGAPAGAAAVVAAPADPPYPGAFNSLSARAVVRIVPPRADGTYPPGTRGTGAPNATVAAPDLNGDGVADADDLALLDRDGDGRVDADDVAALDVDGDGDVDVDDLRVLDVDGDGDVDGADREALDFDGDGDVDGSDLAVLDLDGDGAVDAADLDVLDADGDGDVDPADLAAIAASSATTGAAPDLNGDGVADADDLAVLDRDGDGSVDADDIAALDVDGDGDVDVDDLRVLDVDGDGDVDGADRDALDFDGDGDVDGSDLAVLDLDGDGDVDIADLDVLDANGDGSVDPADLAIIAAAGPRLLPAIESVSPLALALAVRFEGPTPSTVQWRSFSDTEWNGASHRPPLAVLSGLSAESEYFVRVCDPGPSPAACTAPHPLPVRPLSALPPGVSPDASGALPPGAFYADSAGIAAPYEAPSRVELVPSIGGINVRFEPALRMDLSPANLALVRPACRAASPVALAHRVLVAPAPLIENIETLEVRELGPGATSVRMDGLVPAERYEVLVRAISPSGCVSRSGARRFEGLPARVHGTQVGHRVLEAPAMLAVEALFEGFRAQWSAVPGAVAYRVEYLEGTQADFSRYVPRGIDVVAAPTLVHALEGLRRGAVYSVRVRAIAHPRVAFLRPGRYADASLLGPPSEVRIVEIGAGAPAPAAYAGLAHAAAAMLSRETGASVLRALDTRFALASRQRGLRDSRGGGLDGIAAGIDRLPPGILGRLGADRLDAQADHLSIPWPPRPLNVNRLRSLPWSAWLAGETARMASEHAGAELDGSLNVLHLAVETAPGAPQRPLGSANPWVAGIGFGFADGRVDYTRGGKDAGTGRVDLVTVLTYPYVGYRTSSLSGYVTAGGGVGTSTFSDTRFEPEGSDQDHTLAFAGTGFSLPLIGAGPRTQTLVRSSLVATRTRVDAGAVLGGFSVSAHQLRVGLESRMVRRSRFGTVVPSAGFAFRHLAGDDPTGTHLDASIGLDFTSGRFHLSGHAGRALLSIGDAESDWRAGVNARIAPRHGGRGLSLGLSPNWNLASTLGGAAVGGPLVDDTYDASRRAAFGAEIGYGFYSPTFRGLLTPFLAHRAERGGEAVVNVGLRFRASPDLSFALRATERVPPDADRENSLSLHARFSF